MGKGVTREEVKSKREKKGRTGKPREFFPAVFYRKPIMYLNKNSYSGIMLYEGTILLSKGDLWLMLNN